MHQSTWCPREGRGGEGGATLRDSDIEAKSEIPTEEKILVRILGVKYQYVLFYQSPYIILAKNNSVATQKEHHILLGDCIGYIIIYL